MTLLSIIGETKMVVKLDNLDTDQNPRQMPKPHRENSTGNLLLQIMQGRIRDDHCYGQNLERGIANLRVAQSGQTGYHGCLATNIGNKHNCENLGNSMTGFSGRPLYICEYKQTDQS